MPAHASVNSVDTAKYKADLSRQALNSARECEYNTAMQHTRLSDVLISVREGD
jgi:hypothetical protein